MFPIILQPISVILSLTATAGVFIHDTQIYNAVKVTGKDLSSAFVTGLPVKEMKIAAEQHIHIEPVSSHKMSSQQPTIQPRSREDKKYITAVRRLVGQDGGSYTWPIT